MGTNVTLSLTCSKKSVCDTITSNACLSVRLPLAGGESIPEHPESNFTEYVLFEYFSIVIELPTRLGYNFSFFKVKYAEKTISKSLKVHKNIVNWDHSSAGEHYAEDVGVLGSTPSGPIYFFRYLQKDL